MIAAGFFVAIVMPFPEHFLLLPEQLLQPPLQRIQVTISSRLFLGEGGVLQKLRVVCRQILEPLLPAIRLSIR